MSWPAGRRHLAVLALVAVALAVALATAAPASAQSSGKTWRIGMLSFGMPPFSGHVVFVQALRDRGYVEGQNLTIVYRYAEGRGERLPQLAAELVAAKVDVIVTTGAQAAIAVRKATGSIPIVTTTNEDPVAAGLAVSLARPGGNVTGVALLSVELAGKRLQVLKEMLPRVSRVGVLGHQGSLSSDAQVEEMQGAARHLGIHVMRLDARTADEVDRAFERAKKERVGAIVVLASALFVTLQQQLISLAERHRLPAMYNSRNYVEAGGLMVYGQDIDREGWTRMAIQADRILKGARPAELPFEQLTKIELIINAKTARALGLAIPPSLLHRAEIIE